MPGQMPVFGTEIEQANKTERCHFVDYIYDLLSHDEYKLIKKFLT